MPEVIIDISEATEVKRTSRGGIVGKALSWLRHGCRASAMALAATALAAAMAPAAFAAGEVPVSTVPMATTQSVSFENEYAPDPVSYAIPDGLVTKRVQSEENYDLAEGKYTFEVYESDGFDQNARTGTLVATGSNYKDDYDAINKQDLPEKNLYADTTWTNIWVDADGNVLDPQPNPATTPTAEAHPRFWFEHPGTYTYYVLEKAGNEAGVTYTSTIYTLRVVVTSENGKLVPTPYYYLGSTMQYPTVNEQTYKYDFTVNRQIGFVNIYAPSGVFSSPTDVDQQIEMTKTLTGRSIRSSEFTYALYDKDDWDTTTSAPKVEDGTPASPVARGFSGAGIYHEETDTNTAPITINQLAFNRSGDYTFYLIELGQDNSGNGVTYDHDVYKVTAHVTANGDTFDVVWELDQGDAKTDNPNYMDSINSDGKGTIYFNNAYVPAKSSTDDPAITKILTGRDWISNDAFQIRVVADEGAPELDFDALSAEYKADAELTSKTTNYDGTVSYVYTLSDNTTDNRATFKPGVRTVTVADFAGVREETFDEGGISFVAKRKSWDYVISEVRPDDDDTTTEGVQKDGVTYDEHSVTVTMTATDNLEGRITISNVVSGNTTFSNSYAANVTVSPLEITKTLNNHKLVAETFPIQIVAQSRWAKDKLLVDNWSTRTHGDADPGVSSQYSNLGGLNSIEFSQEDIQSGLQGVTANADGTRTRDYEFLVSETRDSSRVYFDWDENSYLVTIQLKDDGKGNLSTETTVKEYDGGIIGDTVSTGTCSGAATDTVATVPFVNTYNASGSFAPTVAKTLFGRDAHQGEFGFTMTQQPVEGATVDPDFSPHDQTRTNPDSNAGLSARVAFAEQTYTVEQLEAMVQAGYATKGASSANANNATYTLYYNVSESGTFAGGTFPRTGEQKTGKLLSDNGITWGAGEADTYDFDFSVTLTDNGEGVLAPTFSYPNNASSISFVNTYKASGTALLQVEKHLDGRPLRDATGIFIGNRAYAVANGAVRINGTSHPVNIENNTVTVDGTTYPVTSLFKFNLNTDETDEHVPSTTKVVDGETVSVPVKQVENIIPDDDSNTSTATFGLISFDQGDVRDAPYVYVVTEDQVAHASGYIYSPDVKLIMPQLVDNEDGTLSMRTSVDSNEYFNISEGYQTSDPKASYIEVDGKSYLRLEPVSHNVTFENSYSTDYVAQTITATKLMPEGGLQSKLFTFKLVPQNGAPLIDPTADGNEAITTHDDESAYDTQSVFLWDGDTEVTHGTAEERAHATHMTATNNFSSVNFGNFRYDHAGTYQYLMTEIISNDALAEINPYALGKGDSSVTPLNVTYANRASLRDTLRPEQLANLKWRDNQDYLYDDNQFLVTVTVSDYGDGQLAVDSVTYQKLGTATAAPFTNPEDEDYADVTKADNARFLNHNTFRAQAGIARVTFSKQLLGRNYWVNHTADDMKLPWKINWFPQQNLTDEAYGFSIVALGAAGQYDQHGNPRVDPNTGLPFMRKVQYEVEVNGVKYGVYKVTYDNGSSVEPIPAAYFNPSDTSYTPCEYDVASDTYTVPAGAVPAIHGTDSGFISATPLYTSKDFTDLPAPKLDLPDGDGNYLALVKAVTSDGTLDALTAATISGDYSISVDQDLLMSVGDLRRADIYYRIYEAAPNSATITLPKDIQTGGVFYPENTRLPFGIWSDGVYYEPNTLVPEGGLTSDIANYAKGTTYVLRNSTGAEAVDPEVQAKIASREYLVATSDLRDAVANDPDLEWTYKGVTYRSTPFYVCVTVTASTNSSNLVASVAYATEKNASGVYEFGTGGSAIPNFDNHYEATGTATLDVTKNLLSYDWDDTVWSTSTYDEGTTTTDEGFTFTISPIGNAPMPSENTVTVTKDDVNEDGITATAHSLPITFKLEDLTQAPTNGIAEGDFIYQIREDVPSADVQEKRELTYDESVIYARVHVIDNMDGTLKTEVRYYTDPTCSDTNEIKVGDRSTGTTYEFTEDTAVIYTKEYYKLDPDDPDGKTYIKVWNPLESNLSNYYEQKQNEGAIFTNVGLEDLTVEKQWIGVSAGNATVHVIRAEVPAEALEGAESWLSIPGWQLMTDNGWDPEGKATEEDYEWSFVDGNSYIFPRGATGDELIHTFENLPAQNPDTGQYYVYGIYEDSDQNYVPSYRVEDVTDDDGNVIGEKTVVTNTSLYAAEGGVNLTMGKDLEGKEQKGRSWSDDDRYEIRLIPVRVTTGAGGTLTLSEKLKLEDQPMPQSWTTIGEDQYQLWTVTQDGQEKDAVCIDGSFYLADVEAGTIADDPVSSDIAGTAKRKNLNLVDTATITSHSDYVTPTERAGEFVPITFVVNDLTQRDSNSGNLYDDFYYIMRERIPDGAVAYLWRYELVAGTTDEYMRSATEPASGVAPYKYGTTPDSTRELYVWRDANGVYYDTSMDLVHIHVADSHTHALSETVTHHKMVDGLIVTGDVDTAAIHPNEDDIRNAEAAAMTFGAGSVRTQPVFDNYYDADGVVDIDLAKFLADRAWTDEDSFTFTLTPATGNENRPMPEIETTTDAEGHPHYWYHYLNASGETVVEEAKQVDAETPIVSVSQDGKVHTYTFKGKNGNTIVLTATVETVGGVETLTWTSATITLTKSSITGDGHIGTGSFDIPVELADLSRANANSRATGTFVYRIEEAIPDGATENEDGTYTKDGLIYTNQPVYVRLTVTDDTKGGIVIESVEYTWDEVGNNPLLDGQWLPSGTAGTKLSATANFLNRQTTALALTKSWAGFGYAVQDSTFTLQSSSDLGKTWHDVSDIEQKTITAGTPNVMFTAWTNLPAYDADGNLLYYRAREEQGANSAVEVTYGEGSTEPTSSRTAEGGFTEQVTNTYEVKTTVDLAMVKELNGRDWLDSDAFTFKIVPDHFSTYEGAEGTVKQNDADYWSTVHGAGSSFPLPRDAEGSLANTATASIAQASAGYLGEHQYLAPFESISIDIHDLTLDRRTGFMTGDFYYKVYEQITVGDNTYTAANLDDSDLPEGITKVSENHYLCEGVTYDMSEHTVHVHVQGNRVGELIVTTAYDESKPGDTSTGTKFTPVVVNSYKATAERQPNASKLLLTRTGGGTWGSGEGHYDEFFFVQHSIGSAPFVPTEGQSIAQVSNEERAIEALRSGSYDAAYTGEAMYTRVTSKSENDAARYIPTPDTTPDALKTYYVLDGGNYTPVTGLETFTSGVTYYQLTTSGRAKYQPFARIQFSVDDLNREVGVDCAVGDLMYSDGTTEVPKGHKYGIFEYSFNEVVPATGAYDTISYDTSTAYSRVIVIDRGDGTLDMLTQYADGRLGTDPSATIYSTTTAEGEGGNVVGKAQFTNAELIGIDVTKDWGATQASEPVTFQLYRTTNKTMVADAAKYRAASTFDVAASEEEGWVAVEGATVTVPAGATGEGLSAKFEDQPVYNAVGEQYIYRVGEVGLVPLGDGTQVATDDGTATGKVLYQLVSYDANVNETGDRHFTVTNTSEYASDGTALISVVKELGGRAWLEANPSRTVLPDGDVFTYVLEPVGKADITSYADDGTLNMSGNVAQKLVTTGEGDEAVVDTSVKTVPMPTAEDVVNAEANAITAEGFVTATQRQASFETIKYDQSNLVQVNNIWQGDFFYKIREQIPGTAKATIDGTEVTYAEANADGSYITAEQIAAAKWVDAGITYSTDVHEVHVHVEDDSKGIITTNISYDGQPYGSAVPVYVNTYDAHGSAIIETAKSLQGYDWDELGEWASEGFTFALLPIGDVPMASVGGSEISSDTAVVSTEVSEDATVDHNEYGQTFEGRVGSNRKSMDLDSRQTINHNTTFHQIDFNLNDLPRVGRTTGGTTGGAIGSFVYAVNEVCPDEATQEERALSYDGSTIYVKVIVEDNLDGTLSTTVRYYSDAACTKQLTVTYTDGTAPAQAAIFTNSAFVDIDTAKVWIGEATRGANIRAIRTTASMLAAAGVVDASGNEVTADTILDQAQWMNYIKQPVDGDILNNTSEDSAPKGWEYVAGTPWTFPQNPNVTDEDGNVSETGWQHSFVNLPSRDANGDEYIYGIWEGGRIEVGGNEIASVVYGYSDDTITVTNTSNYHANGELILTAAKDLEGKDQKGRNWTTDDRYDIRLIPVTAHASFTAVANPTVHDLHSYYEQTTVYTQATEFSADATYYTFDEEAQRYVEAEGVTAETFADGTYFTASIGYLPTTDTTIKEGKTYYSSTMTVDGVADVLGMDEQPMPTPEGGSAVDRTTITSTSSYVTPTERQGVFDPINFTIDDLVELEQQGKAWRGANNKLYGEYFYVMRELIPDGAVAYNFTTETVAGSTETMRVATTKAPGVDPYVFGTTHDSVREQYVWEKGGVFYDTAMDLVHVHVNDAGDNELSIMVDHHKMEAMSGNVITFGAHNTRTQPVFDNYYDAFGTADLSVTKTIYGRTFTADDSFVIRVSAATGINRPLPTGADAYWGLKEDGVTLEPLAVPADGSVPEGALYADIIVGDPDASATPAGEIESSERTLGIDIELPSLTRPDASSPATATFVYRLEEIIPDNAEAEIEIDGVPTTVTYHGGAPVIKGSDTSANMTEAEVLAAIWHDAAGTISYTTTPVYAHVVSVDDTKGELKTETTYFWDEAGRNPIRDLNNDDVTSAPFANVTLTSVYVEKDWVGFDYAVQDTTFQLQQTNNELVGRYSTDPAALAAAKSYRDPNDDGEHSNVRWVNSTVEGNSVTFEAGTPSEDEHASFDNLRSYYVYTNLPTFDATGSPIYYRVLEAAPQGVSSIKTSYDVWFSQEYDDPQVAAQMPDKTLTDGARFIVRVENEYHAEAAGTVAVVKELQGRPWLASDRFTFVIEPTGVASSYDATTGEATIAHDAERLAAMPMPADDEGVSAVAAATMEGDPIGGYEYLATFKQIKFNISDLVLNQNTGYMTGDFYYELHEAIEVRGGDEGPTLYALADLKTMDEAHLGALGISRIDETHYSYDGMTYDLASHTVHFHVQGNKLGELIVTSAYDESTPGDTSTGTAFTPVVVNSYSVTGDWADAPKVSKSLVASVDDPWATYSKFDFMLRPLLGAPFKLSAHANDVVMVANEEAAVAALDEHAGAYTGGALYVRVSADEDNVDASRENAYFTTFAPLSFEASALARVVSAEGELTFSDGTPVGVGTRYDIYQYALTEIVGPYTSDVMYDNSTCSVTVTVIDTGGGNLDIKTEYSMNGSSVPSAEFTNVVDPDAVQDVTVVKEWNDGGTDEAIAARPKTVTVHLLANGTEVGSANLSADGWTHTFADLPVLDDDGVITYTVSEEEVDGYLTSVSDPETAAGTMTFTLTNTASTDLSGTKTWENDDRSLRPYSITVHLLAGDQEVTSQVVTPGADGSWTYAFKDMPLFDENGAELVYRVSEDAVDGYEASYKIGENGSLDIVNTYQSEDPKTGTLKVYKLWAGEEGDTSMRREVNLVLTGTTASGWSHTWEGSIPAMAEGDEARYVFESLPLTHAGESVSYTVREQAIDGYVTTYQASDVTEDDGSMTVLDEVPAAKLGADAREVYVTNTREVPVTSVTATKVWDDADDRDGLRPDSIELTLQRSIDGTTWEDVHSAIVYENDEGVWKVTWDELPAQISVGDTSTAATGGDAPDTLGTAADEEAELAEGEEGLLLEDVEDAEGSDETSEELAPAADDTSTLVTYNVVYRVVETPIDGYETVICHPAPGVFKVFNVHQPKTMTVSATKVWIDNDNADGLRADVTLHLLADGTEVATKTIPADATGDALTVRWDDMPINSADGSEITYTVEEDQLDGYASQVVTQDGFSFTVTNTHAPLTTSVSATKVWAGDEGHEDARGTVTLHLLRSVDGGEYAPVEGEDRSIAPGESLEVKWENLPTSDAEGHAFDYSVSEEPMEGYACVVSPAEVDPDTGAKSYVVTNAYGTAPSPGPGPEPEQKIKVTYVDHLAGEGSQLLSAQRVDEASQAVAPAAPTHDGWVFAGWNENVDEFGDYVYVARYERPEVLVVSYVDPFEAAGSQLVQSQIVEDESQADAVADPSHEGAEFKGWQRYLDADGNVIYVANYGSYINPPKPDPDPTPTPTPNPPDPVNPDQPTKPVLPQTDDPTDKATMVLTALTGLVCLLSGMLLRSQLKARHIRRA